MILSLNEFQRALDSAEQTLKAGGIVIYPTDTLYGLGANATSEEAVARVREAKGRGDDKPISIICSGLGMIEEYCEVGHAKRPLLIQMLPGPFTVVLPVKKGLPGNLCGKTVGVRVPKHFFLLSALRRCGFPITGTSANLSGDKDPCSLEDVPESVKDKARLIIDGGKCHHSAPSTVVDMTGEKPVVLRQGAGKMPEDESEFDVGVF